MRILYGHMDANISTLTHSTVRKFSRRFAPGGLSILGYFCVVGPFAYLRIAGFPIPDKFELAPLSTNCCSPDHHHTMGGSPRGPGPAQQGFRAWTTRGGGHGKTYSPPLLKLVRLLRVLVGVGVLLLLWRCIFSTSEAGGGVGGAVGAGWTAGGGGETQLQPSTAYGQLLRAQGLLPAAAGARTESAAAHPSITSHLLNGFNLPGLDVVRPGRYCPPHHPTLVDKHVHTSRLKLNGFL